MSEIPQKIVIDDKFFYIKMVNDCLDKNENNKVAITNPRNDIVKISNIKTVAGDLYLYKNDFCHINIKELDYSIEIQSGFNKINQFLKDKIGISECLLDVYNTKYTPVWKWIIIATSEAVSKDHVDMYKTASWNLLTQGRKVWKFREKNSAEVLYSFLQDPGDLIWIPEGWRHEVEYLEDSTCISQNLFLERSRNITEKEIINNGCLIDKQTIQAIRIIENNYEGE